MSTDNTVQTNLDGEKVYPHKCKWCGKPFTKQHNRQEYCSDECFQYARQEQKAIYQRKRRKQINAGVLCSNESTHIGTGYLSQHRHEDFEKEHASIQKELKRIRG